MKKVEAIIKPYKLDTVKAKLNEIGVQNPDHVCRGVQRVEMDGQTLDAAEPVTLATDGATHRLRITLGHPPS